MELLMETLYVGALAYMVFYALPWNDKNDPCSKRNYFYPDNIMLRRKLGIDIVEEGDTIIEWVDIWPYVFASTCGGLYFISKVILKVSLS